MQARLHRFLGAASFPCVGARAALARGTLQTMVLAAIGSPANDAILLDAIIALGRRVDAERGSAVHGLAAVFAAAHPSEVDFEQALWEQLQRLHALDRARGHRWATDVSSDPDSRHFSMSLGAHPYFVVGLDPDAPRLARRFCWPTLVFNSHRQFQRLKADGRYRKMQDATRQRDRALQGDINPNLADYGQRSEARQYSGRELPQSWRCPLRIDA